MAKFGLNNEACELLALKLKDATSEDDFLHSYTSSSRSIYTDFGEEKSEEIETACLWILQHSNKKKRL